MEQQYLPDKLQGKVYYEIGEEGYEKQIRHHMNFLKKEGIGKQ